MKKAGDFEPEVLRLFDQYVHGQIDRRAFLDGARRFATGTVGAAALLAELSPNFAQAQQVSPSDARLHTERVEFASPRGYGKASGYLARPANAKGKLPGVLVAHENRGLNPHIQDICRRLALDGFMAFGPDALFSLGGYPGDEDKARQLFAQLDAKKTEEDFVAAAHVLRSRPDCTGRIGAVGFCWGGSTVNMLATRVPELAAAVPFYGSAPPLDGVPAIKARLLLVFAENDERVNASWPPYEAALKAAHVPYEVVKFAGTLHGFNNDTTPRYDATAAKQAWTRTVALFDQALRQAP